MAGHLVGRGREDLVDHLHLSGMDGEFGYVPRAAGQPALGAQRLLVAVVHEHAVYRMRDAGCSRGEEHAGSGIGQARSRRFPLHSEIGHQVALLAATEHDRLDAPAATQDLDRVQHSRRGLDHRYEGDRALRLSGCGLQPAQGAARLEYDLPVGGLGNDHAFGSCLDGGHQVLPHRLRAEAVDANEVGEGAVGPGPGGEVGAGGVLGAGGHGILQVDDHRVSVRPRGLDDQVRAVPRGEEHGTDRIDSRHPSPVVGSVW